jgi:hypothetical protein
MTEVAATRGLRDQLEAADETNRYARAVFRALDRYTFEDSDHGRLIAEAVKKLEETADATDQTLDYSQSDGETDDKVAQATLDGYDAGAASKDAELSTLKEQLRLTNEMLAAADHIGGYLDIARGTTWSIHSDHDSGWHYSIDDKIVASGKSMVEAFAAIREQQNEASTPSAAHSVNADGSCNLGCC